MSALEKIPDEVAAENPEVLEKVRQGETTIPYLVGQVMRRTLGKADPEALNRLIREKLLA